MNALSRMERKWQPGNHKRLKGVFCLLTGIAAITGVAVDMLASGSMAEALDLFVYFTIQSNLLGGLFMVATGLLILKKSPVPLLLGHLSDGATLWLLVTHLVYHFMLSGVHHPQGVRIIANIMMHYATPWLMLLFFLLFSEDTPFHVGTLALFCSYPALYACVSVLRGSLDGFFPYWFLKPYGQYPQGNGSYLQVLLICLAMFAAFAGIGSLLMLTRHFTNGLIRKVGRADGMTETN